MSTFALIHGGGGSAWDWHLVVPELRERGHDAVAVDLPSEDPAAGWWDYADTVVEAVGDRDEVVVVGHSLGGFTAPLVCARQPVDLLVLLAGMIPAPGELFGDWWKNTGYEESGYDDVFYHDVPPELAAEAQRGSATKRRRRCSSPGRSRPGRTCLRSTSSAATTACSRPSGRADTRASGSASSRTRWRAVTTSLSAAQRSSQIASMSTSTSGRSGVGRACRTSEAPLGGASQASLMRGQCASRRKRSTARSPILLPCSIPSSTALRKWKPTRMRESPFSAAAWEKLL